MRRGRRGQVTGQVCVTETRHAVFGHDPLILDGRADIPPALGGKVNSNAAGFHPCDHLPGNHERCSPPRYLRRGDDEVHLLALPCKHPCGRGVPLLAHLLGISACAAAVLNVIDLKEMPSHCLDLLLCHGTHVEGAYGCTHALCSLYRGESCDARAHDKDLRGRDLPGGLCIIRQGGGG